MATGTYDTEVNQGDTWLRHLEWVDANEEPIDLSTYTARMQLRTSADAIDYVLELTTENGYIVLGDNGTFHIEVPADVTAAIEPGSYRYDLEMITGGFVRKILRGKIKVVAEVTK